MPLLSDSFFMTQPKELPSIYHKHYPNYVEELRIRGAKEQKELISDIKRHKDMLAARQKDKVAEFLIKIETPKDKSKDIDEKQKKDEKIQAQQVAAKVLSSGEHINGYRRKICLEQIRRKSESNLLPDIKTKQDEIKAIKRPFTTSSLTPIFASNLNRSKLEKAQRQKVSMEFLHAGFPTKRLINLRV